MGQVDASAESGKVPMPLLHVVANTYHKLHTSEEDTGDFPSLISAYAFGVKFPHDNPELRADFDAKPKILKDVVVGGQAPVVHPAQFYLGPAGSGAPMHYHNMAVNVVAFGRKRWFLYPPGDSRYS